LFSYYFLRPFGIYNVKKTAEDFTLIELKCWEEQYGRRRLNKDKDKKKNANQYRKPAPPLVPKYHEISDHFELSEDHSKIESMNIIYNVVGQSTPQVLLILSEFNDFLVKRLDLNDDFTRILRQSKTRQ
jgi:hypothetical protein